MKPKILIPLICSVLYAFIGCIREKFDPDTLSKSYDDQTTIATPIGFTQTSLQELFAPQIDSGVLVQDADGLLWFRFNQDMFSLNASDLIQFPDFDTTYAIINNTGLPIDLNAPGVQAQISQSFFLDFGYSQGLNGELIDSIWLNTMNMDIDVQAPGSLNASLNANFPGILYNNLTYSKNLIVSSLNTYADLMAYTVHLQNSGPDKNQLLIDFTLNMGQTSRVIAPGETILNINLHFSAIDFEALFGYIGQIDITAPPLQQTIINLMNDRVSGYFNFDYGYFDLISRNSFGVPFSFKLDDFSFQTFYIPTGNMVFENTIVPTQTSNIPFPNLTQFGQTIDGDSPINTGSVQLAFQDYYSTMSGTLSGTSNPNGQQEYNFVLKNSQLEISTGFSVPFWGYTDNFHTTDTINFALAGFFSSTFTDIERLLFVINFTNAFPMDAKTQIYFCNASGTRLDSMFLTPFTVIGSSSADGNGKVGPEPNEPVKVEFLADRLSIIQETAYLMVQSDINTVNVQNTPPVSWKFFSDYYFYTHIGVAATVNQ
jgi:hypothetical protein